MKPEDWKRLEVKVKAVARLAEEHRRHSAASERRTVELEQALILSGRARDAAEARARNEADRRKKTRVLLSKLVQKLDALERAIG